MLHRKQACVQNAFHAVLKVGNVCMSPMFQQPTDPYRFISICCREVETRKFVRTIFAGSVKWLKGKWVRTGPIADGKRCYPQSRLF